MTVVPASLKWQHQQLTVLDQSKLPLVEQYIPLQTIQNVYEAIVTLKVRGAPVIGITAAYGLAIAAQTYKRFTLDEALQQFEEDYAYLASSRPTAVNLFWALNRIAGITQKATSVNDLIALVEQEAQQIHIEDEQMCKAIGEFALQELGMVQNVMTICNAGTIATAKYGTALAAFHLGAERNKLFHVYACETRPIFQGGRLTTWELQKAGVPVTLITDSMAAHTIEAKNIEAIIVGADRIAANGDTANKIGTRGLAILAKEFGIPFYVAAPSSTFDLSIASGKGIPIEERKAEEITQIGEQQIAPNGIDVFNPAFDVTPAQYITAIITENGVIRSDFINTIQNTINKGVVQK